MRGFEEEQQQQQFLWVLKKLKVEEEKRKNNKFSWVEEGWRRWREMSKLCRSKAGFENK